MDKVTKISQNNLVRIDKNIANNSEAFELDFQGDDEMVSSLLMYAAWQRKNHLFDYGTIDPEDFAKTMGFAPKYLTSVHPHPACLDGMTDEQKAKAYQAQTEHPEDPNYRIFDSRFENALYLLLSRNLTFRRAGSIYTKKDGSNMQKLTVSSVRLLKSFEIVFRQSKRGKKKLYYNYELAEEFSHNLSLLYVTANIEDFTALRKKSLHKLYLYVKNQRDNAIALFLKDLKTTFKQKEKRDAFQANFDLLCQLAGIGSKEARDKKARLVKAFKELSKVLPIELVWTKAPGSRWEYEPIIIFLEIRDTNKLIPADKADPIGEKVDIFTQNFFLHVISAYKEYIGYETGDSPKVHDYSLLDSAILKFIQQQERSIVETWYMQAQLETFTYCTPKSNENFDAFHRNLQAMKCYNDVKDFLFKLFQSQVILPKPLTVEDLKKQYAEVHQLEYIVTDEYKKQREQKGEKIINIGGKNYLCK